MTGSELEVGPEGEECPEPEPRADEALADVLAFAGAADARGLSLGLGLALTGK